MKDVANNRMLGKESRSKGDRQKPPAVNSVKCATCGESFNDVAVFRSHMAKCKGKTR